MIRGIQYLTHTRPDIANAVGISVRFQADPKESHLMAVKRIFKYLKGTMEFGLWYDKSQDLTFHAFINVDWEGNIYDIKSTSGGVFFLGKILVSWCRLGFESAPKPVLKAKDKQMS